MFTESNYNGILPCFFGARFSRLLASIAKALITAGRVCFGSITTSTKPRSAALYGVANSSTYLAVLASLSSSFLKIILAAPAGPITAISDVGQAYTWSAPKSWEHIAR